MDAGYENIEPTQQSMLSPTYISPLVSCHKTHIYHFNEALYRMTGETHLRADACKKLLEESLIDK